MKKRKWTSKVVNLDTLRESNEALFSCMFPDCDTTFSAELPKRKNATEDMLCPRCGRDFFICWKDDSEVIKNHGLVFYDMIEVYKNHMDKKSKRKRERNAKKR
jgi:hypothetical protein